MDNKKYVNSFVAAGNFISHAYDHYKKYSPITDKKTKKLLFDEVVNYLTGFDIVLSQVEITQKEEFITFFEKEVDMANELKILLAQ